MFFIEYPVFHTGYCVIMCGLELQWKPRWQEGIRELGTVYIRSIRLFLSEFFLLGAEI